ncbi:hypothetical protein N9N67_04585 [Bacteriovoracaceae bacterium]|nr:hypothetical protein [Bacteriovoracaceae bacterium]
MLNKKLFSFFIILSFNLYSSTQDTVCTGGKIVNDYGKVSINIGSQAGDPIIIDDGSGNDPMVIKDFDALYDGHAFSLITAPGVSIKFMNGFGCIQELEAFFQMRRKSGRKGNIVKVTVPYCQQQSSRHCNR